MNRGYLYCKDLQYKINFWERIRIKNYENEGSKKKKGGEKGVAGE